MSENVCSDEGLDHPLHSHSLIKFWIANDAKSVHADNEDYADAQAYSSLCLLHMSEGRFSHVVAQMSIKARCNFPNPPCMQSVLIALQYVWNYASI